MSQVMTQPNTSMQVEPNGHAKSEATAIEKSRAVAEVQSAVIVAQERPRDVIKATSMVMQSCKMTSLAERAFFSFKRGTGNVTGGSIHLATELARCWGNVDYGIKELNRDDKNRMSEMLAFAWDLETNTRAETTFQVPHKRSARGGVQDLIDVRDIYENNANMGARRLREMIFRILPPWLVEDAKDACHQTLTEGGGVPIEKRRALCVANFDNINITREQLEAKLGKSVDVISEAELANLRVASISIQRGELSRDDFLEGTEIADLSQALNSSPEPDPLTGSSQDPTEVETSVGQSEGVDHIALVDAIEGAKTLKDLGLIEAEHAEYLAKLDEPVKTALDTIRENKRGQLEAQKKGK